MYWISKRPDRDTLVTERLAQRERVVLLGRGAEERTRDLLRKNETPSALISGAIRGALRRSGRYAKRSIATPSRPRAEHRRART